LEIEEYKHYQERQHIFVIFILLLKIRNQELYIALTWQR